MGILSRLQRRDTTPVVQEQRSQEGFTSITSRLYSNEGPVESLSAVFSAIQLISNSIAVLPIRVKNKDTGEIVPHYVTDLFTNSQMTCFMLIKTLVTDAIIHGRGCAYIDRNELGAPMQLIYCEPTTTTEFYNKNNREHYFTCPSVTPGRIDPRDMICIYTNTKDGVQGKAIISYAKKIFDLCKYSDKAASDFYASGCAIDGILSVAGNPSKDAIEQIRSNWNDLHSPGTEKYTKVAVLPGNIDYKNVSYDASSAQMLETREFNVKEVARFFNISPTLLGDLSNTSYNSVEQALTQFVTCTLLPYIVNIEQELTRKLLATTKDLTIDLDEKSLLRTDKSALATYLSLLVKNGIITRNEARKLLGMPPVDGGDDLIIPFTKIQDNTIGSAKSDTAHTIGFNTSEK